MRQVTKQQLGAWGEQHVARTMRCPKCKREKTLVRLPANFKCADLICDFCGFLAQVKTARVNDASKVPKTIMGAAWGPQSERMAANIYFPLFLVLTDEALSEGAVYYLAADLQEPAMFQPRAPLSQSARRAGWQGFRYDLSHVDGRWVRLR
jgi:Dam-replacing family